MLGHFVADLKYKRIYVTSIDALVQAPVWEKSRTLRVMHAAEIFQSQKLDADKLEIKMIEAGKIEAIGDMDKKVRCAAHCSYARRIGAFCALPLQVNLLLLLLASAVG